MASTSMSSVTSSPGSVAGQRLFVWPVGPLVDPSGPAVAPANRSRRQERKKAQPTSDICGQNSTDSSSDTDRQKSLESRLRAMVDLCGSPECVLTWKRRVTSCGLSILQLRALGRRSSGNDSSGELGDVTWPSVQAHDAKGGKTQEQVTAMKLRRGGGISNLNEIVMTVLPCPWSAPTTRDHKDTAGMSRTGTNPDGSTRTRDDHRIPTFGIEDW